MKVNSWVKRIRRSSSFQAEGWRRTSAASVSSLVAQWHGERGFLHHYSPGFLMLWTHEAASGKMGALVLKKCSALSLLYSALRGREGREGEGGCLHNLIYLISHCVNTAVPQTWQDPFPVPRAQHGMNFQGLFVTQSSTQPQGWQPAEVSSEELIKSWPPRWLLLLVWWWRDVPRNKLLWEAV